MAETDRPALIAAAWLDGARFLREEGWPEPVVGLVAHHSAARYEAEVRELSAELARFPFKQSALQDALDTADLTTGPGGESLTFDERVPLNRKAMARS